MLMELTTWSCLEIRMQDSQNVRMDNRSLERVEEFIYLGMNLTSQNLFRKKLRAD
jgi:hypothetical protein